MINKKVLKSFNESLWKISSHLELTKESEAYF